MNLINQKILLNNFTYQRLKRRNYSLPTIKSVLLYLSLHLIKHNLFLKVYKVISSNSWVPAHEIHPTWLGWWSCDLYLCNKHSLLLHQSQGQSHDPQRSAGWWSRSGPPPPLGPCSFCEVLMKLNTAGMWPCLYKKDQFIAYTISRKLYFQIFIWCILVVNHLIKVMKLLKGIDFYTRTIVWPTSDYCQFSVSF